MQDLSMTADFLEPSLAMGPVKPNKPQKFSWVAQIAPTVPMMLFALFAAVSPFIDTERSLVAIPAIALVLSLYYTFATKAGQGVSAYPSAARLLVIAPVLCAHFALTALLGMWGISPPGSVAPLDTLIEALRLCCLALFFLLACDTVVRRNQRARMLFALYLIILAFAVGALISEWSSDQAINGPFANRNSFASFLGMGLIIGVSLAISFRRKARSRGVDRALRLGGLWTANLLLLIALLFTTSRMGIGATGAGLFTVLLYRRAWQEGLAITLVATAAFLILGHALSARIAYVAEDFDTRLQLYIQVLDLIRQRPLTGFGAGSFALAFETVQRPPVPVEFLWDRAHSNYLKLWVENGVIAGTAPMVLSAFTFALIWRGRTSAGKRTRDPMSRRSAPAAALGALVLCATHSLVDFSFEILANQLLLVALIALGLPRAPATPSGER